jgi:hypothetical protein
MQPIPTRVVEPLVIPRWESARHDSAMHRDPTYPVVIECPTTHSEVETGLVMSKAAFATPAVWRSAFDCPRCGERHEYDMGHAWLQTQDERRRRRPCHPFLRGHPRRRRPHEAP